MRLSTTQLATTVKQYRPQKMLQKVAKCDASLCGHSGDALEDAQETLTALLVRSAHHGQWNGPLPNPHVLHQSSLVALVLVFWAQAQDSVGALAPFWRAIAARRPSGDCLAAKQRYKQPRFGARRAGGSLKGVFESGVIERFRQKLWSVIQRSQPS
jgi:hypothetical protein